MVQMSLDYFRKVLVSTHWTDRADSFCLFVIVNAYVVMSVCLKHVDHLYSNRLNTSGLILARCIFLGKFLSRNVHKHISYFTRCIYWNSECYIFYTIFILNCCNKSVLFRNVVFVIDVVVLSRLFIYLFIFVTSLFLSFILRNTWIRVTSHQLLWNAN